MAEEGTYSPEVSVGSIMLLRLVTTLWLKSPKTPEKIPTINPSNDPTRVPENSRLDRPLAHPSYQGELIIKVSPIYTYIHGQKVGYTLGISLINHVHSSPIHTHYMHTKYGVLYSTPHGPPNVNGPHSFFGEHAFSHTGCHVLGLFSEC